MYIQFGSFISFTRSVKIFQLEWLYLLLSMILQPLSAFSTAQKNIFAQVLSTFMPHQVYNVLSIENCFLKKIFRMFQLCCKCDLPGLQDCFE